jgi:hypothetical protein
MRDAAVVRLRAIAAKASVRLRRARAPLHHAAAVPPDRAGTAQRSFAMTDRVLDPRVR